MLDQDQMSNDVIKRLKRDATRHFEARKSQGRQITLASSQTKKKKVFHTRFPLKKLDIILPTNNQQKNTHVNKENNQRRYSGESRRENIISERTA